MSKLKPLPLPRKKGLYLQDAGEKGRGVFCTHDVRRGEELEVAPSLILNSKVTGAMDGTILRQYTFIVGNISKKQRKKADIKSVVDACAVIMGLMTFCNHSEKPNAEILWEEHGDTVYYSLVATRNIPKGTEICTTYGGNWFKDRGVKPK